MSNTPYWHLLEPTHGYTHGYAHVYTHFYTHVCALVFTHACARAHVYVRSRSSLIITHEFSSHLNYDNIYSLRFACCNRRQQLFHMTVTSTSCSKANTTCRPTLLSGETASWLHTRRPSTEHTLFFFKGLPDPVTEISLGIETSRNAPGLWSLLILSVGNMYKGNKARLSGNKARLSGNKARLSGNKARLSGNKARIQAHVANTEDQQGSQSWGIRTCFHS